jgi:hypothetical protein
MTCGSSKSYWLTDYCSEVSIVPKPNSWTYNFVAVSGHNHRFEVSVYNVYCILQTSFKPLLLVVLEVTLNSRGKLFRLLSNDVQEFGLRSILLILCPLRIIPCHPSPNSGWFSPMFTPLCRCRKNLPRYILYLTYRRWLYRCYSFNYHKQLFKTFTNYQRTYKK